MARISISNCPICDGTEFRPYLNCKDYTTSEQLFSLKTCQNCHFTLTDPRPDDASLADYYVSKRYISHTEATRSLSDRIYFLARKITLRSKRKIVQQYSNPRNILDVGCGTGEFIQEMNVNGWYTTGVEPSRVARASAEKKTPSKIYESIFQINEAKYGAVTLWHVLEHVPDLNQSLSALRHLLEESGTIFIAVPNLESYDANFFQSFWAAYDVPRHLWHFSQGPMKTLLAKHGFKLKKILPMRLDSYYVSLLSAKYKYPKKSTLRHFLSAFLVGLKSNLKAKKNKEYSSLIYIAKR